MLSQLLSLSKKCFFFRRGHVREKFVFVIRNIVSQAKNNTCFFFCPLSFSKLQKKKKKNRERLLAVV